MGLPFDPEQSARETGHAADIPPNIAPLGPQERVAFAEWARRQTDRRDGPKPEFGREAETADDFLSLLAKEVEAMRRYLTSQSGSDGRSRDVFWDHLTNMHLLVDRIEVLMLQGVDFTDPQPHRPDHRRAIRRP